MTNVPDNLDHLLENNRQFAQEFARDHPELLQKLAVGQWPSVLWIGCVDSRVSPDTILKLGPGDLFVYRSVANVFRQTDLSGLAALQFAVEKLKIRHIVVTGHYGCGGIAAVLSGKRFGQLDNWLSNIKDVYQTHRQELEAITDHNERDRRLVQLNARRSAEAVANTNIVQDAWARGQPLTVWAWVYDVATARLTDLGVKFTGKQDLKKVYRIDVA